MNVSLQNKGSTYITNYITNYICKYRGKGKVNILKKEGERDKYYMYILYVYIGER